MGSTSYVTKPKSTGYRVKSGSSVGSDKEMSAKLKRTKIRRPSKMNEYGLKRIPDYTELAYKEAVSKLRYFLSGNYAPSVRSYGGSASVKNLDESDGDLDKKYTSSYTLAEYKPRPRLTTKYATLYADSLNNYTPPHVNTTSVPPATATAGDVTGGTNPDVINFIQKQEEYIEQLERESQYCRDELNNLLGKVKEVISENEHLHEAQKNKLISRMFHSYNGSESDDLDELGDSTGLDSDNKTTPLKARKSAKARSTRLEGPNIVFESRIAELEAQLTQSKIDLKKVQEENNENKRKLASGLVDSTCLDGFKRQIDNLQRDKSSLESQISKLKLSLEQRDDDGRYKRGSDAVEHQLREERNNLEAELRRLKDDLAKERSKVRELAGEGARRAIQERSAAEQRYNAHFDELQHDLAAQYDNVAKLQLDLERQRREENELKRELSMKNAAIDELKMELKNKISSLQADLAQAHAEKASLEEELASARLAIERQQRQAKHETNRLNSEIQSLRQRLDRADADLVHSRRENLRLSEQISNLEKEQTMKNLTPISPEKNKKEKELSTMLESMENKHAKTVAGLESMIQSQNSLMEKLTGECRLLTDKLDDANRRHKQELATLQRQVNGLSRSMQSPHNTPSNFQAHPPHQTTTDRNVPHPPSDSGRDYSGTESPGHTTHGPDERITTVDRDDPYETTGIDKTAYQQEEHHDQQIEENVVDIKPKETEYQEAEHFEEEEMPKVQTETKEEIKEEPEKPMEVEHTEAYETQQYEYDQNYEQTPATGDAQYENQFENYEQQPYADQQYENYEQYPQEAVDPNAQYHQEYENYPTDGNYTDQNYDTTQYAEGLTEAAHDGSKIVQDQSYDAQYAQEYQADQNAKIQNEKVPESIKSQEKPSSQS
ncbi:serologically defined colon cancer antigen 8 homolog isoform X1 [Spodoptera litura]|uniref:Serologically defined colon cancer antigen 8 homolog isoform X1 n=2 Tax=Spodoptera litura TaxID=69820 RepID=A0A9J7ECZ5_SPOLT|nr:serologically defined colon cancer antigen 8 homolog isoform X1 [Spodoptera litura]